MMHRLVELLNSTTYHVPQQHVSPLAKRIAHPHLPAIGFRLTGLSVAVHFLAAHRNFLGHVPFLFPFPGLKS